MANLPATEACARFAPSDAALALLKPNLKLVDWLTLLAGQGLFVDAVHLLAHALPRREAVWWAARCARSVIESNATKEMWAALKAAEEWAADPSEPKRRAAESTAAATQYTSPAGCAALAAFLSGGSLAPAGVAEVPPGPGLTAKSVANAIQLAALADPARTAERFEAFLTEAAQVVNGTSRWP
jgi:hypothetical protein